MRNAVLMEPLMDGCDGFLEWTFQKRQVIVLAVVVCHRARPPLGCPLPDVLQTAVEQCQHVMSGLWIEAIIRPAAREVDG